MASLIWVSEEAYRDFLLVTGRDMQYYDRRSEPSQRDMIALFDQPQWRHRWRNIEALLMDEMDNSDAEWRPIDQRLLANVRESLAVMVTTREA